MPAAFIPHHQPPLNISQHVSAEGQTAVVRVQTQCIADAYCQTHIVTVMSQTLAPTIGSVSDNF